MKRVRYTKLQIVMELCSILCLLFMGAYLLINWEQIPQQVPIHYNWRGQPDAFSSKISLLFLAGASLLIWLMLTVAAFFPQTWNVPVVITPANEVFVHRCMLGLLCSTKLCMTACFAYIAVRSAQGRALSRWFLLIFALALFGSMVYYIVKTRRGDDSALPTESKELKEECR